jgi:hypothetical protein
VPKVSDQVIDELIQIAAQRRLFGDEHPDFENVPSNRDELKHWLTEVEALKQAATVLQSELGDRIGGTLQPDEVWRIGSLVYVYGQDLKWRCIDVKGFYGFIADGDSDLAERLQRLFRPESARIGQVRDLGAIRFYERDSEETSPYRLRGIPADRGPKWWPTEDGEAKVNPRPKGKK